MSDEYLRLPSFKTLWLKAICFAEVPSTAKLVGFTLGAFMNSQGRAWPSMDTLAESSGTSRSTVKRQIPVLEKAKLLDIHRGGGRHKRNTYQAHIPVHLWTRFPEELVQRLIDTGSLDAETGSFTTDSGPPDEPRSSSEVVEVQHPEVRSASRSRSMNEEHDLNEEQGRIEARFDLKRIGVVSPADDLLEVEAVV